MVGSGKIGCDFVPAVSAGLRLPAAVVTTRAASYAAGTEAVAAENVSKTKSGWRTPAAEVSWIFGGSRVVVWRPSTASASGRGWLAFGGSVGAGLIAVAVKTCLAPGSSSVAVSMSRSVAGAWGKWEFPD